ncbi:MAG: family 1 encapsulin nanocompartment shell protein [Desulfurococcus sp.]|nr:family 1 encapsulin nanocompartment shell protein [Desulfurococcus sp.]
MLSKHPLDLPRDRKLSAEEAADALRLAIIAELDAINLYLQLARAIEDEKIRRVFEDIANEEKTHVGEFLSLLEVIDPRQVEELKKGAIEVKELTGLSVPLLRNNGNTSETSGPVDPPDSNSVLELVKKAFISVLNENRTLRKYIQVVDLGRGVESTVIEKAGGEIQRTIIPLKELSVSFRVTQRDLDYASRSKTSPLMPELYQAALKLALMEDSLILESIISSTEVQRARMGDWDLDGTPVTDVASAVSKLYSAGAGRPFILVVSPSNYARTAKVSEKRGLLELERITHLVDSIVVSPVIDDNRVVVASTKPFVLDLVTGGDVSVDYIGPEKDLHLFRAWELIALRVKHAGGIIVLER